MSNLISEVIGFLRLVNFRSLSQFVCFSLWREGWSGKSQAAYASETEILKILRQILQRTGTLLCHLPFLYKDCDGISNYV